MATWQEVKSFVKSNYKDASESPDGGHVTMTLAFTDGRSQFVAVHAAGNKWIQFLSMVGEKSDINVERLFEESHVFGVTTIDDSYWLVHNQLLETVDGAEINAALLALSECADEVEKALTGGRDEH